LSYLAAEGRTASATVEQGGHDDQKSSTVDIVSKDFTGTVVADGAVPSNGNDHPIPHGYLDLIDMSLHTFLSFNFIIDMVLLQFLLVTQMMN
jgi:hypothetical protein